ncbi:Putative extracellular membrane protein, CFEM [Colletotrichum destructivum]|uniref:Extracellular membrane protein, CFEM n=1 Tax=Colletotrichum destructivum TaxID=34406 RepID=A0AAX4I0T6_9PEZI|nr:Putative extracellular membrane protein, CFEM [Colletotrichum destructivum]
MHVFLNGLLLVAAGTTAATASPSLRAISPTVLMARTPECSMPCLLKALQAGRCANGPIADCVCTDMTLQSYASTCVQMSCDFSEQIVAAQFLHELCQGYPIPEERREFCRMFFIVLPIITAIVVSLRFVARWIGNVKFWWDDWTALVALIFLLPTVGCSVAHVELGFGLHYWHVEPGNAKPILQACISVITVCKTVTDFAVKLFYATQIFYVMKQVAAKASICALYLRIFTISWHRVVVIGLLVSLVFQHFLFIFLVLFQCMPIQMIWDRSVAGRCLNITAIGYAGGALTITYDVILIILPIPELWKLNLERRKKLVPILMLALGSIACVASMIRLRYLISFANTFDATWDNVEVVIWSTLEINLAMVCGSLPTLRPLIRKTGILIKSFRPRKVMKQFEEPQDQTRLAGSGQFRGYDPSFYLADDPRTPQELKEFFCRSIADKQDCI